MAAEEVVAAEAEMAKEKVVKVVAAMEKAVVAEGAEVEVT